MEIETVNKLKPNSEIKFEDLEPGVVFEFNTNGIRGNPKAIKLIYNEYVMLTFSEGNDWLTVGDKSMLHHGITKVYGKLVGLKVQI